MRPLVALLPLAFLTLAGPTTAQVPPAPSPQGSWFVYWGYNRSGYSWSNIHFNGPDYDFTLRHVEAKDRPSAFSLDNYFNPKNIWLPQYNYRIGFFLHERWSLSLGLDHMKYVMVQDQAVHMDGWIGDTRSHDFAVAEGGHEVVLTEDFLTYEHTDGLNLLCFDMDHYDPLWASRSGRQRLHVFEGAHLGMLIPRSDVRLFGEGMNNAFHVAGVGVGAQLGVHFTFCEHLFLRGTARGSWIDLPSVLTTGTAEDRANQHFWAYQGSIVFGGQFKLGGRKKDAPSAQ
ncbi:MAG: hypothetical protein JNL05_12490 [Flavobacteriales bacterium]|nr:hypothetical protein [Flavobacteriales bacterium]